MDGHINEKSSEHMVDMLKTIKMLRTKVFEQDTIIRKNGEPFDSEKIKVETSSSSTSAMGITDTKESISSSTCWFYGISNVVKARGKRFSEGDYIFFYFTYKVIVNIIRLNYLKKNN